ncbi:MAG: hypothetical protein HY645_14840 [Acidobacteria bacterium]|nr:hypothetical protein [Acidobacteriota bacterium]
MSLQKGQHRIWNTIRRKGDSGGIEYELNGKRADVAVITPNPKIAYEVVWNDDLPKELSNLEKDLAAGFDQSRLLCPRPTAKRRRSDTSNLRGLHIRASLILMPADSAKVVAFAAESCLKSTHSTDGWNTIVWARSAARARPKNPAIL